MVKKEPLQRLKTQIHTVITLTCVCDFAPVSYFIVMAHKNECFELLKKSETTEKINVVHFSTSRRRQRFCK